MPVKYVKDFKFDQGFGFTGSAGKVTVAPHVRNYAKGGHVKQSTSNAQAARVKQPVLGTAKGGPLQAIPSNPQTQAVGKAGKLGLPGFKKGGKARGLTAAKAVSKHEGHLHKGQPKTKLARGGGVKAPSGVKGGFNRTPMFGNKC